MDLDMKQLALAIKTIAEEKNLDERIIRAVASHGYGLTAVDIKPEHIMEKVLFAADELTGLIGAVALMRPSKSVQDLELKSLKKKLLFSIFLTRIFENRNSLEKL